MTPMAYAWTLFSGPSIIKRRLTWTNDNPFAGSEVYGDVYQVVGVPLYTDDECNARVEAAEKEAMAWKRAVGDERRRHKDLSIKEVIDRIIHTALEAKP